MNINNLNYLNKNNNMKASEFKLSVVTGVNSLIDDYFGSNSIADKFINSTLKIIVKQNTYKIDEFLSVFMDEHGMIDENIILEDIQFVDLKYTLIRIL